MGTTSVPALLRQQVDRWAETWLTAKFSRLLELRAQDPGPFNYLLEHFGHARQAASLRPLARKAKSLKPHDPSVRIVASLARSAKVSEAPTWKLSLNVPLEIDA